MSSDYLFKTLVQAILFPLSIPMHLLLLISVRKKVVITLIYSCRVSPPPSTDIKDFSKVFLEMLSAMDLVPFEKFSFSKYPAGPF